jgi:hypothetical protein
MLKEFTRSLGMDPDKILIKDALAEPPSLKSTGPLLSLGDPVVSKSKVYGTRLSDTYEAALGALESNSFEIKARLDRRITAFAPASIFSWGEDLEISIEGARAGTKVTVSSSPRAQIFDWGKSEENINRLIASLDKTLGREKTGR